MTEKDFSRLKVLTEEEIEKLKGTSIKTYCNTYNRIEEMAFIVKGIGHYFNDDRREVLAEHGIRTYMFIVNGVATLSDSDRWVYYEPLETSSLEAATLEIAFQEEWYKEHVQDPTIANFIDWALEHNLMNEN